VPGGAAPLPGILGTGLLSGGQRALSAPPPKLTDLSKKEDEKNDGKDDASKPTDGGNS
jgi:hypothetical protein